jgi:hypothetical protein
MPEPEKRYDEPPTLPVPSLWRLIVAAAAIIGFLYFLYDYESRRPEAPPAGHSRLAPTTFLSG